jgi:CHAT domain-containing protein/tetratricopeptide (TPR) repeat protein
VNTLIGLRRSHVTRAATVRRAVALALVVGLAAPLAAPPVAPFVGAGVAVAQPASRQPTVADLAALTADVKAMGELFKGGKYAEAVAIQKRVIAALDRFGMGKLPMQAQNYAMLGDLHRFLGDFGEAEKALRTSLTLLEATQGKAHPDVVQPLLGLHHLRVTQGRYTDAATFLNRAVAIREATLKPDDPELSWIRVTQAKLAHTVGRPDVAVTTLRAALAVFRAKLPPDHPYVGTTVNNLAEGLIALGAYAEAEPLLEEAVKRTAAVAGATSPLAAVALSNLANLHRLQGRLLEAEDLHRRELAISEAALGPESLDLVPGLGNYALVLDALQRPREAEPLLRRALGIQAKHLKPDHPDVATTKSNLATVLGNDGRHGEARALLAEAVRIREAAFGRDTPPVATALQNLAVVEFAAGRQGEAIATVRRALAILEAALPAGHPAIGVALNNLGASLGDHGKSAEWLAILDRALALREAGLGPTHPDVVLTLVNIATGALDVGDVRRAYDTAGRAIAALDGPLSQMTAVTAVGEAGEGTLTRLRVAFLVRAVAAERLRAEPGADVAALENEAFVALQRDQETVTGAALQAASLRAAAGDPTLARLVRERQDHGLRIRALELLRSEALGRPATERDPDGERRIAGEIDTLVVLSRAIDGRLAREFPAYAALTRPTPLTLAEARAMLAADDALLVVAPSRLGALVFAVTNSGARLVRSPLPSAEIERMVGVLRCGLDGALWTAEETSARCLKAVTPQRAGELPFDVATAHALHVGLLGPVADLIDGKRLRVVTTGALTALPFQVLVTAPPRGPDTTGPLALKEAAWLGRRHAVSMLPSVGAYRRSGGRSATTASGGTGAAATGAAKPYLAIANPLIVGADGTDRRAFDRQSCRQTSAHRTAGALARAARTAAGPRSTRAIPRPTLDIESLRRQTPLPETADEVCAVALLLGAGEDDVLLGARATLSEIKARAARNQLDDYRVIHLASHGFVAGGASDLERGLREPAILLTPPAPGTTGTKLALDNGLLSASDIAGLRLDADWVVLSACNTAAGGRGAAEPLSGLARAFFYAGARGLLVSHWEVYSVAAVTLVTRAFEVWRADPAKGRAHALAVAMADLQQSADPFVAHPSYWAPFVVVGAD